VQVICDRILKFIRDDITNSTIILVSHLILDAHYHSSSQKKS